MNIEQAKQIDICSFLDSIGVRCAKQAQYDAWYYAPDRDERTASFHIFKNGTRWYDFGSGMGGDIIDLVKRICGTSSTADSLNKIEELASGFRSSDLLLPGKEKEDYISKPHCQSMVISTCELCRNLLMYSRSRGIHDEVIKQVCKQINFKTTNGKVLYGIGFRNDCHGWEIRNPFYKGCIGKKQITSQIDVAGKPIIVCEGFFDYLSLIELGWIDIFNSNIVVLNSTSLVDNAISIFLSRQIILCLDNDTSGKNAGIKIKQRCEVIDDWSQRYNACKDVNEFLMR